MKELPPSLRALNQLVTGLLFVLLFWSPIFITSWLGGDYWLALTLQGVFTAIILYLFLYAAIRGGKKNG